MMIEWHGDEIERKLEKAVRMAMDETMADCVKGSKAVVPVRTATLQGSIQMRPTQRAGNVLVGYWGSFNVLYAIYVEMGTSKMPAQPYLRPVADRIYPSLASRIKRAMA